MFKFIFVLLFISSTAYADEWTSADTKREAIFLSLHAADWGQTHEIARNPFKWSELNKGLPVHPSVGEVDQFFSKVAIAHVAIAYMLPVEWRVAFQYLYIAEKVAAVGHNFSIGLKVKF